MGTGAFDIESDDLYMMDHDQVCMVQANQLLLMGCLEYETAAYGSAYLQDGLVHYYLSSREESMKKFRNQACFEGIYHTPIKYFCKRYDLLEESEEEINQRFRKEAALKLEALYPKMLLEAAAELNQPISANNGFPILQAMTKVLENSFDLNQLGLFANLLEMLLQGRQINREAYLIMQQWLNAEYEKNAVETIKYGVYKRQYAGFAYEKPDGSRQYFIDALPYLAEEKQTLYLSQGYIVTPILTITYSADAFANPVESRAVFKEELSRYLDDNYLALMRLFRRLPPSIDRDRYQQLAEQIADSCPKAAVDAFRHYGYLCNAI